MSSNSMKRSKKLDGEDDKDDNNEKEKKLVR